MLTEGARKIYRGRHGARGRRVGQGCTTLIQQDSKSLRQFRGITLEHKINATRTNMRLMNFVYYTKTQTQRVEN
jgi:hypothetical protein